MSEKEIGNLLHRKSLEIEGKKLAAEGVYHMLDRECLS
jgi:hypothetical protein